MHLELLGQLAKLQAGGNGREGIKEEREVGREGGKKGRKEERGEGKRRRRKGKKGDREVKTMMVENAESILNIHG